jgi:hypothetical protein
LNEGGNIRGLGFNYNTGERMRRVRGYLYILVEDEMVAMEEEEEETVMVEANGSSGKHAVD